MPRLVAALAVALHVGFLGFLLLGGFASHLAYHAPCPVLLVRPVPAGGG